jgi:acyl-CoA dehydrogenase family protein 10
MGLEPSALGLALSQSTAFQMLETGALPLGPRFFAHLKEETEAALASGREGRENAVVDWEAIFRAFDAEMRPDPAMLNAALALQMAGVRVAAITNNWRYGDGGDARTTPPGMDVDLADYFSVVVESCRAGVRKPEAGIYDAALHQLDVAPSHAVLLDDIGNNCKGAAAVGMTAILVRTVPEALRDLAALFPDVPLAVPPAGTTPAAEGRLDASAAVDYACRGGYMKPPPRGFFADVREFGHGQSNPTFFLGNGRPGEGLVLRKKPPGKLVPGAHAVEREYRITAALSQQGVPVAQPLVLCEDDSVLGTPFYLAEYAAGNIFVNPNLPTLQPAERRKVCRAMAKVCA